jgi:hypothetical protein
MEGLMAQRWLHLGVAAAMTGLLACGSDVSSPVDGGPSPTLGKSAGGTDTAGTGGGSNPTSNDPVASLTLTPRTLVIPQGSYAQVVAMARDAAGVRVVKKIAFTSSDPNIAVASDTGVIYGKALGTTKIYASVDGFKDSATVMIIQGPPPPPPPTQTAPVAEFNMTVVAFGRIPGTDTSHTERVSGSTITLSRVGGVSGDTLSTPQAAGSAVADANGEAKFTKLAGGSYTIKIVPPAGSAYLATQTGIGPPRQSDITVHVTMQRP